MKRVIPLDVLIVEASPVLGDLWSRHLARQGARVTVERDEDGAMQVLRDRMVDVIVADLDLPGSGAMAVADYAAFRQPEARVVFVTASSFFSDGAVFAAAANACACLPTGTAPGDLAQIVAHHATRPRK